MHHIYHTEAVVLSSRPSGESGKYLTVLSKEFGILKIEAQAVRANYSKLRFAVQDYSISEISFVRGKTGNKLVNASFISNFFYENKNLIILKIISKIFKLIEKMITDEEPTNKIYNLIITFKNLIKENKNTEELFLKNLEIIMVYKILFELGYISLQNQYAFLISEDLNISLLEKSNYLEKKDQKEIIKLINQAINESHL